jgi:hypothetical protein
MPVVGKPVIQVPFYCEACGYGQAGDDGKGRGPQWDSKTYLLVPPDEEPTCPNKATMKDHDAGVA